jgi:uncharacterized protein YkwD
LLAAAILVPVGGRAIINGTIWEQPGRDIAVSADGLPAAGAGTQSVGARSSEHAPSAFVRSTDSSSANGTNNLISKLSTPASSLPQQSTVSTALAQVQITRAQLAMVNADRAAARLAPLQWSDCLATLAAQRASRLGSLDLPPGQGPNCGYRMTAENFGYWSSVDDATLNRIFLANQAERSNILGTFHRLGAAWVTGATGIAYLVVEFA